MVDLPESWVAIALSDAVSNIAITDKKIPQKEYLSEGAYPVFDQGRDYIGGYSEKKEKLVDCELPVLVFGDHTRVVKFVSQPFAPGADGIKVLQPQLFYNPRLLEYFTRHIATHLTNHGYARHYQHLMKSEIPLPPTNEQHRIVAKIEELFSELDKGIENLKTARAQLKVYRQALLKHAFEGKLTAISSGAAWPEKALGDLLDFLTSGSRGWAQYYAAAGDLFIRAQNIKHDQLDLSDIAFVSLPERTEGLRTRVKIGDLLITITGANVTKSALVERDVGTAYVSQHVALCRPTAEVIPRFLYWFIVAEAAGRKQLSDMAYGAGKPGLNLENIRSVLVPMPGLPEQEKIVGLIEGKLSEVDQLNQTITTALQQAEALRQSILKKAFAGLLVPQDPHDEPASTLLARIQAERVKSPQPPFAKGGRSRSGRGISAKPRKASTGDKLPPVEASLVSMDKES